MPIPLVVTNVANGAPATVSTEIPSRCAVIGTSFTGSTDINGNQATKLFSRRNLAIEEFTEGPLIRAGVHLIDTAKREVIFQRAEASNPGEYDTIDVSGFSGTAEPSVVASEVPRNEYELYILFEKGGAVDTDPITYKASTAGGRIDLSGLRSLPGSGRITFGNSGTAIDIDPPETEFVALAVDLRATFLAHYNNAVAHSGVDATAIAALTLDPPTTTAEAVAVINQCITAHNLHLGNNTVHNSFDVVNAAMFDPATTAQEARAIAILLKTKYNAHRQIAIAANPASLLAATATVAAPVTIVASSLLAGGLAQLADYPSPITFTTAGGTPAHAPDTADIAGADEVSVAQSALAFALSQIAGTATTTESWSAITQIDYVAADGTDATVSIGTPAAGHNSADVTNVVATADPPAGTIAAGSVIQCQTFAPYPSAEELAAAFDTLAASGYTPGFVLLPGRTPASYIATISAGLDVMRANGKPVRCMVQARRRADSDASAQAFRDNLEAEVAAAADNRICWESTDTLCTISEGATRVVPAERYTGYAINLATERIIVPFWQTTWQVGRGNLPGVRLTDDSGVVVGWNEPPNIDTRLQLLYQVPNAELGRPTVASVDYTLAGEEESLKTMQAGLVEDEIVRVIEAYHWSLVGLTQAIRVTSPGFGVFADDGKRQSIQRTAAARLRDRPGLQQGISDIDRADLVTLVKEVPIVQGTIRVEFVVKWTPAYPIGEITTTISVDTGVTA